MLTNQKSACRIGFGGDVEAASTVFSRKAKHGANSGTSVMGALICVVVVALVVWVFTKR